jgi:hypothetical protein
MFNNISWQDYLVGVSLTLTVYYVAIGLRFYSVELKTLLTRKAKFRDPETQFIEDEIPLTRERQDAYTEDEEYAKLEKLLSSLKSVIEDAGRKKYVLAEFKQFIRKVFNQHPGVKVSNFRSAVNEFVVSECEKSDLSITEEQIDMLWE